MGGRHPVLVVALWVVCLLSGRGSAQEGQLDQIEKRLRHLEQISRPNADTRHAASDFVIPGVAVLALAAFCALWARSTGRDPWLWLAAGLVFNVFALLAVWAKHEGDKKVAKGADSGGPFERPREGGASSQNVRPASSQNVY
jgi:hypothetical protein